MRGRQPSFTLAENGESKRALSCLSFSKEAVYVISLFIGVLSWMSKGQTMVALSLTEIENMTLNHAAKEVIWPHKLHKELGVMQGAVKIRCDSRSDIFLANVRTKHISIQHHFIREKVEQKTVVLEKIDIFVNSAYFFYEGNES